MSEFSTKINQITYEERVHDMIGELSCHDHEKIVRHHLGVCYELYENLEAKIARLESRGIEDMKYRIKILESALRDVDMLIQNGQIAHARDAIKRALEAATP